MSDKYLKDKQYYYDLYDRHTVEFCQATEERITRSTQEREIKEKTDPRLITSRTNFVVDYLMYFEKGQRYKHREETVNKWIERDRKNDEKIETTLAPDNIACPICNQNMEQGIKTLHHMGNEDEKVLFFFRCIKCKKNRAIYEDGQEFEANYPCPKCSSNMDTKHKKEKDKITTFYNCPNCGYTDQDVLVLKNHKDEQKEKRARENFEKNKNKYCLSEEQGQEYLEYLRSYGAFNNFIDEQKEKEKNKHIYDAIKKLNKLSVSQLKKTLADAIEKNNYQNLLFSSPEMGKDVQIEFTCEDAKEDRHEYDSRMNLKKIIIQALQNTNWILMTTGINYRMGV